MLYLIGLGLSDPADITLKGLEIVKNAGEVYLEHYTSILGCDHGELEKLYGRSIKIVDREMMEVGCQEIFDKAKASPGGAAVLVVGDPLNATTHSDLILRAVEEHIPYHIIHNASIVSAVACCGLQIYQFGETISIPFWTDTWKPESFYDKLLRNLNSGLHTLCLLDIKVKEPNLELLARGIKQMDPPRFMTVSQAAEQLLEIINKRKNLVDVNFGDEINQSQPTEDSTCIGLARIGSKTQMICKCTLREAISIDFGQPLHSLVIPGTMHPLEVSMTDLFAKKQI